MSSTMTYTMTAPPKIKSNVSSRGGISYKPMHKTFAAEASGIDFDNVTPEVVGEIKAGLAKVSSPRVLRNYGRQTS